MVGMQLWRVLVPCLLGAACSAPPPRPHSALAEGPGAGRLIRAIENAEEQASHLDHEHGAGTQAVNLFLGGSREDGERNGFTFGLDYEYRVLDDIGVGGFSEATAGLHRAFATGGQVYWHAWRELVLTGGVGAELKDHHTGEGATWDPIVRIGASYEIPLSDDGWVISPAISYDFTQEENLLLFGANLGYVF